MPHKSTCPGWFRGGCAGGIASVVALAMRVKSSIEKVVSQSEVGNSSLVSAFGSQSLSIAAPSVQSGGVFVAPVHPVELSGPARVPVARGCSSALSSAWSAWLSQYRWDWFGTLTLRSELRGRRDRPVSGHPESFVKAFRRCLLDLMTERVKVVEGWRSRREREWRVRRVLPVWFLGLEGTRGALGANVRLHGHFLAWFPEFDLMPSYGALREWWQRERGFADVSHPRSVCDVSEYVGKYLTKAVRGADTDFEWFASDNFGVAAVRAIEQPHLV